MSSFGNNDLKPQPQKPLPQDNSLWDRMLDWNWNGIVIGSWVVLALICGWLFINQNQYKSQLLRLNQEQQEWGLKEGRREANASRVVMVPVKQAGNLTPQEGKMIKELTDLFSTATTFDSASEYQSNYHQLKHVIKDPAFFNDFMTLDRDRDGNSMVSGSGKRSITRDVRVYPTGGTSYVVVVEYTQYHSRSDLNQESKLLKQGVVFDVQGTPGNITKAQINKEFSGDWNMH